MKRKLLFCAFLAPACLLVWGMSSPGPGTRRGPVGFPASHDGGHVTDDDSGSAPLSDSDYGGTSDSDSGGRPDSDGAPAVPGESSPEGPLKARSAGRTSGEYMGQKWYINEKHLLVWDEKPYVPFGLNSATIGKITDLAIWSDADFEGGDKQRFEWLDKVTDRITARGGTYFMLFLMHPELTDLSQLGRSSVRSEIVGKWRKFAPAVRKKGLRAITFYNEINLLPAPPRMSANEYGRLLNGYASEMKKVVGDVPVILKIVNDWSVGPAMAAIGGDYIDGLGGDFFAMEPDASLKRHMSKSLSAMKNTKRTKLFWITEFSRMAGGDDGTSWPAFRSRSDMHSFLDVFVSHGATGFFYFDINEDPAAWKNPEGFAQVTPETARWYRELKPEIVRRVTSRSQSGK